MSSTTLPTSSQDASTGVVTRSRKRLLDEEIASSPAADPRDRKKLKMSPQPVRRSPRHTAKSGSPTSPQVGRSEPTPSTSRSTSLSDDDSGDAYLSDLCRHPERHATEQGVTYIDASPTPASASASTSTSSQNKRKRPTFDEDEDDEEKATDDTSGALRSHSSKRTKLEDVSSASTSPRHQNVPRTASTRRRRSPTCSPPPQTSTETIQVSPIATLEVGDVSLEHQIAEEELNNSISATETSKKACIPVPGDALVEQPPSGVPAETHSVVVEAELVQPVLCVDKQRPDASGEEAESEQPDARGVSVGCCAQTAVDNPQKAEVWEIPSPLKCGEDKPSSSLESRAPPSDQCISSPDTARLSPAPLFPSANGAVTGVPLGIRGLPVPLFDITRCPQTEIDDARTAFHRESLVTPQVYYAIYPRTLLFRFRPSSPLAPNPGGRMTKQRREWLFEERRMCEKTEQTRTDSSIHLRSALENATSRRRMKLSQCKPDPALTFVNGGKRLARTSVPMVQPQEGEVSGTDEAADPETYDQGAEINEDTVFETQDVGLAKNYTGGVGGNVFLSSASASASYNLFASPESPAGTTGCSDDAMLPQPDLYPSESSCTTPQMQLDPELDVTALMEGQVLHSQGMTVDYLGPGSSLATASSMLYLSSAEPSTSTSFTSVESVGYMSSAELATSDSFTPEESGSYISHAEPGASTYFTSESGGQMSPVGAVVSASFASEQSSGSMSPVGAAVSTSVTSEESGDYIFPVEVGVGTSFTTEESAGFMFSVGTGVGTSTSEGSNSYMSPVGVSTPFTSEELTGHYTSLVPEVSTSPSEESGSYMSSVEAGVGSSFTSEESGVYIYPVEAGVSPPLTAEDTTGYTSLTVPDVNYSSTSEEYTGSTSLAVPDFNYPLTSEESTDYASPAQSVQDQSPQDALHHPVYEPMQELFEEPPEEELFEESFEEELFEESFEEELFEESFEELLEEPLDTVGYPSGTQDGGEASVSIDPTLLDDTAQWIWDLTQWGLPPFSLSAMEPQPLPPQTVTTGPSSEMANYLGGDTQTLSGTDVIDSVPPEVPVQHGTPVAADLDFRLDTSQTPASHQFSPE